MYISLGKPFLVWGVWVHDCKGSKKLKSVRVTGTICNWIQNVTLILEIDDSVLMSFGINVKSGWLDGILSKPKLKFETNCFNSYFATRNWESDDLNGILVITTKNLHK